MAIFYNYVNQSQFKLERSCVSPILIVIAIVIASAIETRKVKKKITNFSSLIFNFTQKSRVSIYYNERPADGRGKRTLRYKVCERIPTKARFEYHTSSIIVLSHRQAASMVSLKKPRKISKPLTMGSTVDTTQCRQFPFQ